MQVGEVGAVGAALGAGDELGEAAGERHAAVRDAEQDEVLGAVVALEDLVGDAGQGTADLLRAQHPTAMVSR